MTTPVESIATPMREHMYRNTESFKASVRERLEQLDAFVLEYGSNGPAPLKFDNLMSAYKAELQRLLTGRLDVREDLSVLRKAIRLARGVSKQLDEIHGSRPDIFGDYQVNQTPKNGAELMLYFATEAHRQLLTSLSNLHANLSLPGGKY